MKRLLIIAALCAFCIEAVAQEKRYEVKSGIVTMEMSMMGQNVVQKMYFDDYGAKQASISEFGGQKMRNIEVDGKNIMIDDAAKTATKMPAMGVDANKINFLNLTDKVIKKNKIKEIGKEEIAGKECTRYTYKVLMMGQAVTVNAWVYKGIPLKTSTKTDFGEIGMSATAIEEDVQIDPAMFTIPEGIEIQEMNMGMMGGGF